MKKTAKTTRFRIGGVVKAMNLARERLSGGLAPGEVEEFCAWVHSLVTAVEHICREHRCTPAQLPAPTFRAYCYLKGLKIESPQPGQDLAEGDGRKYPTGGPQRVRITSLIAACSALQSRLEEAAVRSQMAGEVDPGELRELRDRICKNAVLVEQTCSEAGATPGDLPAPSRRAYQWLKFLSEGDWLELHLNSLRRAMQAGQRAECRRKLSPERRKQPVSLEFYHLPGLYRAKVERDRLHIVASEGFIGAPEEVLEALVCSAMPGRNNTHLARVRQYASEAAYTQILQRLERVVPPGESQPRGAHYDLEAVFERVNAAYFASRLEKPRLAWNRTITHRKLGHYQPAIDTVILSVSLDQTDIPEFLIDFVMYHELLHKAMGIQVTKGRQYAHTHAFREAERRFQQYAEAVAWLKRMGQKPA